MELPLILDDSVAVPDELPVALVLVLEHLVSLEVDAPALLCNACLEFFELLALARRAEVGKVVFVTRLAEVSAFLLDPVVFFLHLCHGSPRLTDVLLPEIELRCDRLVFGTLALQVIRQLPDVECLLTQAGFDLSLPLRDFVELPLNRFELGFRILCFFLVLQEPSVYGLFLFDARPYSTEQLPQLVLLLLDLELRLRNLVLGFLEALADLSKVGAETLDLFTQELAPLLRVLATLLVLLLAFVELRGDLVVLLPGTLQGCNDLLAILSECVHLLLQPPALVLAVRRPKQLQSLHCRLLLTFHALEALKLSSDRLQVLLGLREGLAASRDVPTDAGVFVYLV